jgi:membrane-anchored mycosin MYCP
MRHGRRLCMAIALVASCFAWSAPVSPASAAVQPPSFEWWMSAWHVPDQVWPLTEGQGVTVAVLDTGSNASLPELSAAVLRGTDTAGGGTDGRTDTDDSNNHGHGTAMASYIAGRGGGRTGIVGLAPEAMILPIRVSGRGSDNTQFASHISAGIRYAVDNGAKVINISEAEADYTDPDHCPPEVMQAVSYAVQHDVVLVAGAGNNGNAGNDPMYPAACPGVLAVGAALTNYTPWNRTERQDYVAVSAFIGRMYSLDLDGGFDVGEGGTSAATAFTSGTAALIRAANPNMPAREVVARIIGEARQAGSAGYNNATGYGVIQIQPAVDAAHTPTPANPPNVVYQRYAEWQQEQTAPAPSQPAASPPAASSPAAVSKHSGGGSGLVPLIISVGLVAIVAVGVIRARVIGIGPWQGRAAGRPLPPAPPPIHNRGVQPGPTPGARPDFRPHDKPDER